MTASLTGLTPGESTVNYCRELLGAARVGPRDLHSLGVLNRGGGGGGGGGGLILHVNLNKAYCRPVNYCREQLRGAHSDTE